MHFAKRILPWVVALALVVPVRADDHASPTRSVMSIPM